MIVQKLSLRIYIGQVDSTENKWFIGGKNCYSHGDYGNVSTEDCYDDSGHAYEIEIQNYGINSKKILDRINVIRTRHYPFI